MREEEVYPFTTGHCVACNGHFVKPLSAEWTFDSHQPALTRYICQACGQKRSDRLTNLRVGLIDALHGTLNQIDERWKNKNTPDHELVQRVRNMANSVWALEYLAKHLGFEGFDITDEKQFDAFVKELWKPLDHHKE